MALYLVELSLAPFMDRTLERNSDLFCLQFTEAFLHVLMLTVGTFFVMLGKVVSALECPFVFHPVVTPVP